MRAVRILLLSLAGVATVATLVWALLPQPLAVDLVAAKRGPLEISISAEGTTRIRETFTITAPVTGNTLRSPVEVGDRVEQGGANVAVIQPAQPAFLDARDRRLAEISVTEAEAAVRLAEANLDRAEIELSHLESDVERFRNLADRGTLPATTLEDARQKVASARAARDAARYELELQQAILVRMQAQLTGPEPQQEGTSPSECCIEIAAPRTGIVLEVTDMNARLVQAGSPLLTIGDPTDLEIEVDLLSADAVGLRPGIPAFVERWGGAGLIEAEVRRVDPSGFTRVSALGIEEQRVRVLLDILTPPANREGLGDRYRVFVRIVVWSDEDVLQVPQSALFRSGGEWAVFLEDAGSAVLQQVGIGKMSDDWAEVISGIAEGDRVVAYPGSAVEEGVKLTARGI